MAVATGVSLAACGDGVAVAVGEAIISVKKAALFVSTVHVGIPAFEKSTLTSVNLFTRLGLAGTETIKIASPSLVVITYSLCF